MTESIVLIIVMTILGLMLLGGCPVALGLGVSGALGLLLLSGRGIAEATIESAPYATSADYTLTVIPTFILMGALAAKGGIASDVLEIANRALGRLPGGLGLAAVGASAGFAVVTGSSVATVATLGRVGIDEMVRHGYKRTFAAGIIGSAGTLGVLIPPSVILVIFGIVTGESIGRLLIAGFIPGILSAVLIGAFILTRASLKPELVGGRPRRDSTKNTDPEASEAGEPGKPSERTLKKSLQADLALAKVVPDAATTMDTPVPDTDIPARPVLGLIKLVVLFLIVVGGIYTGILTATESGAIGAFAALIFLLVDRKVWKTGLVKRMSEAFRESASLTSMIFLIMIGATVFSAFLIRAGVPRMVTEAALAVNAPPLAIIGFLLLMLIPLGMFLDAYSIMVIAVPLLYPVAIEFGFSGIWLAILVVKFIELGLVTPPVGLNAYVLAGVDRKLGINGAFKGLLPFVIVDMITITILFFVPWLSLVLPNQMV